MKKLIFELTLSEAIVLKQMIQNQTPAKENEMIAIMLYARLLGKIEEANE